MFGRTLRTVIKLSRKRILMTARFGNVLNRARSHGRLSPDALWPPVAPTCSVSRLSSSGRAIKTYSNMDSLFSASSYWYGRGGGQWTATWEGDCPAYYPSSHTARITGEGQIFMRTTAAIDRQDMFQALSSFVHGRGRCCAALKHNGLWWGKIPIKLDRTVRQAGFERKYVKKG